MGYTFVNNPKNPPEILTKENYDKTKEILINRLISGGASQYNIRLDNETGRISVELPNDSDLSLMIGLLTPRGIFEIVDSETKEVLASNDDIKDISMGTARVSAGTVIGIKLKFEDAKKLEEISKKYIAIEEVEADEEAGIEAVKQSQVSILIDGQIYKTTYFSEPLTDGVLSIYTGAVTTQTELQYYMKEMSSLVAILKTGVVPITYVGTTETFLSNAGESELKIFTYSMLGLMALILVGLIAKFKFQGIYAFILGIGYISIFSFLIRAIDIILTYEGILGIIIACVLNYAFIYMILDNMKKESIKSKEAMKNTLIKFTLRLIPIYIIAVLFLFATNLNVNSLGKTLFWGALLVYAYNLIFTKILISVTEKGA